MKQYYCDIDIAHLISYNEELAHKLTTEPADIIPLVGGIYNFPFAVKLSVLTPKSLNWPCRTALAELSTPVSGTSPFLPTNFFCTPRHRTSLSVT